MKSYASGLRHDYKEAPIRETRGNASRWLFFSIGAALPLVAVSLLLAVRPNQAAVRAPERVPSIAADTAASPAPGPAETLEPAEPAPEAVRRAASDASAAPGETIDLVVERGDTLEILFRRHGLELSDLAAIVRLPEASEPLRMLRPGDGVRIVHREGEVVTLERELDDIYLLAIERTEDGFAAEKVARDVDVRVVGAHSFIRRSLFESGAEAGLSDAVIMAMAGIFQWDIDFLLDVRPDDQFTILYEEWWRDGVKLRNGGILAAEFVNRGESFRAARFEDPDGRADYYTPEGRSVRKAFIRAPVDFTRVSGDFDPSRRHPVLNTIRAHRGVDYAAPSGTPIRAAGDGKIISRKVDGGFGRAVVIQHGGNITTLYAHMSRFGKPTVGTRVKQGDIIGYVGMSGLATGPHLHYEYRINGVHRNPRTVQLPPADPVPAAQREDFMASADSLWRRLELYKTQWMARNGD